MRRSDCCRAARGVAAGAGLLDAQRNRTVDPRERLRRARALATEGVNACWVQRRTINASGMPMSPRAPDARCGQPSMDARHVLDAEWTRASLSAAADHLRENEKAPP